MAANIGLILTGLRADKRVRKAGISTAYSRTVSIVAQLASTGTVVRLDMFFDDRFPVVKPVVTLLDEKPPHLAHVNYGGVVCVLEDAGLSSNLSDPVGIARWWLNRTLTILDDSYSQALNGNFSSLLNEFSGYWLPIGKHDVQLLAEPFGGHRIVTGYVKDGALRAIDVAGSKIIKTHPYRQGLAQHEKVAVAYLPLVTPVLPPARASSVGPDFIRQAINAQPAWEREKMFGMLKAMPRANPDRHYLLSQQAPDGMLNTVGMSVRVKRTHPDPISKFEKVKEVTPWNVAHNYRNYQVPRGGASPNLTNKTVVIVGCGSLGGVLARTLIQSGVGNLHLVDNDHFSADNVYRHVLPASRVGQYKSEALKRTLLAEYDGVAITSSTKNIEQVESTVFAASPDVVCLATGSPDEERDLIRRRLSNSTTPPIVSGWIEPLSLGGHVMISEHGQHGCLECNFGGQALTTGAGSLVSFLSPGQDVQRSLMGCAGTFTPYTAIDAMQTASIMARTVQERLLLANTPFYRFWRGGDHLANCAGIKTSHWYQRSSIADLETASDGVKNNNCVICSAWK